MAEQQTEPSISGIPLGGLTQATLFGMQPVKPFSREDHNRRVNEIRLGNLERRNQKIKDRFDHMYNVDRVRPDDIIEKLAKEFSLSKTTIETALKG